MNFDIFMNVYNWFLGLTIFDLGNNYNTFFIVLGSLVPVMLALMICKIKGLGEFIG